MKSRWSPIRTWGRSRSGERHRRASAWSPYKRESPRQSDQDSIRPIFNPLKTPLTQKIQFRAETAINIGLDKEDRRERERGGEGEHDARWIIILRQISPSIPHKLLKIPFTKFGLPCRHESSAVTDVYVGTLKSWYPFILLWTDAIKQLILRGNLSAFNS